MKQKEKLAGFLNWIGILILAVYIMLCIPFTIPKLFGLQLYGVVSESMAESYPLDSVVYIKPTEAEEIQPGDVITYSLGSDTDKVMTHRVVAVKEENRTFTTKGDANDTEDVEPVAFERIIGKPVFSIPKISTLSDFMNSFYGIISSIFVFLFVFIIWVVAKQLKKGELEIKNKGKTKAKTRKNAKGWNLSTGILFSIGIFLILGASLLLIPSLLEYRESKKIYNSLKEEYVVLKEEDSKKDENTNREANWWYQEVQIDLEAVKNINSEVIGWIRFDHNEIISYPILYSGDNEKYLYTDLYGNQLKSGSIFLEAANNPDFRDYHTIIYGHNMKDKSMFGTLKNYHDKEYYKEHEFFTIYTENMSYRYEIFACQDVSATDSVYTIGFEPNDVFQEFINKIIKKSQISADITVTKEDSIITLSTCSAGENRFLVHAVLVDYHEK